MVARKEVGRGGLRVVVMMVVAEGGGVDIRVSRGSIGGTEQSRGLVGSFGLGESPRRFYGRFS